MARKQNSIPSYRLHKPSGQGIVVIDGRTHYLGKFDTPGSRERYDRLIGEWLAAGRTTAVAQATGEEAGPTVSVVLAAFMEHAKRYYPTTREADSYAYTLAIVRCLYGGTPANAFGPRALKAVRAEMIRIGWARKHINRQIIRVRHVFKWAVGEELITPAVLEGLRAVDGLKQGRSEAKEIDDVRPVAEHHVARVTQHASRHIAAMIELQQISGMRSGELVIMRTGDLDTSGAVWTYTPSKHKNQHRGQSRIIHLGKRCQEIVRGFMKLDPSAFVFSPADAHAQQLTDRAAKRVTPMSCGNRPGTNKTSNPARAPGGRYSTVDTTGPCSVRVTGHSPCLKSSPTRLK